MNINLCINISKIIAIITLKWDRPQIYVYRYQHLENQVRKFSNKTSFQRRYIYILLYTHRKGMGNEMANFLSYISKQISFLYVEFIGSLEGSSVYLSRIRICSRPNPSPWHVHFSFYFFFFFITLSCLLC